MHKTSILFLVLCASHILCAAEGHPTDIDTLLRGREYKLPALDSTLRPSKDPAKMVQSAAKASAGEGHFVLQFDAVADFDAAQKRREDLQRRTGYNIQMVFDAPFYKLRAGSFTKKADAEDEARSLSAQNVEALVVKIK